MVPHGPDGTRGAAGRTGPPGRGLGRKEIFIDRSTASAQFDIRIRRTNSSPGTKQKFSLL